MLYFLPALFLVVVLVIVLRPAGRRFGLFDHPVGRKNHQRPVLVIGGIAMVLAFNVLLLWLGLISGPVIYLVLALLLICIVGLVDDIHQLSSRVLFLTQIIASLVIICLGETQVQSLGNLFGLGDVHIGMLATLFTLICFMGVINAVNMTDGMDGLAGLVGLTAAAWFAVLAHLSGMLNLYAMLLLLLGVLLGFLLFNMRTPWRKQASIFMGNAGSMSLGLLLTWFAIQLLGSGQLDGQVTPITAVWVIALPLMDMARVMLSRLRQGKSLFTGDHLHLHHMLSSVGYSVEQVVVIKGLLSATLGGIGVVAWYIGIPEWVMFYAFVVVMVAYFYIMGSAWPQVYPWIERRHTPRRKGLVKKMENTAFNKMD